MSEREYYKDEEKDVEKREKDEEKQEKEEKTWEEKWRRDPLGVVVWAVILIWAGVALLADNLGLLAQFEQLDMWGVILVGAGVIVFLEVIVRLLVPAYRRSVGGTLIFAAVLVGAGLGNMYGWNVVWPAILIAIGLSILLRALFPRF